MTPQEAIERTQKCLNSDCDGCEFRRYEYCRRELLKNLFCVAKQQQAELEKSQSKCEDCAGCTQWLCDCANERDQAIKEFAERLKNATLPIQIGGKYSYDVISKQGIEHVLKEMVGDNNE